MVKKWKNQKILERTVPKEKLIYIYIYGNNIIIVYDTRTWYVTYICVDNIMYNAGS